MQIIITDDSGPTARVGLVGKLDIAGAEEIALPLASPRRSSPWRRLTDSTEPVQFG